MKALASFWIFFLINLAVAQHKILVGKPALDGQYPFMASIQLKEKPPQMKHHCGGAIISKKYILTAAHCLFNGNTEQYFPASSFEIYVGSTKLFPNTSGKFNQISKFIVHPDYSNHGFWKSDNDLALIELTKELDYSDKISCLRLARYSHLGTYFHATTMGWGLNELNETVNELKFLDGTGYSLRPKKIYFKGGILSSGVAVGDSGGPLVVGNNRYLAGVLYGYFSNIWSKTAIFTSVPNYLSWLAVYLSNDPCIPYQSQGSEAGAGAGAAAGPAVPAPGAAAGPAVPAPGAAAGPAVPAPGAAAGPAVPAPGAASGPAVPAPDRKSSF